MNCPTTGEVCMYRTHLAKVGAIARLDAVMEPASDNSEFLETVSRLFEKAVDTADASQCDETYCASLASAAVQGLINAGLVTHRITKAPKSEQGLI